MKLKSHELAGRLKGEGPPPAVLLYGQEQGLIREAADALFKGIFPQAEDAEFDSESFYAADLEEERLFTSLKSLPFMAERRLVWIKEGDKLNPNARKGLVEYLKKPAPETTLLITADNLEAKNTLRKAFEKEKKQAWAVPFYPMEGRELPGWIQAQLGKEGMRADPDAIRRLVMRLEGNTEIAKSELEKLILYMGEEKEIGLEDVMAVVGETAEVNGFALATAAVDGQIPQALAILEKLLEKGEEPLGLMALMVRRIRQIGQGRDLLAANESPQTVSNKVRVFWKEKEAFFASCRRLDGEKLADMLLACTEADAGLKGGSPAPNRHIMERLILRLGAVARRQVRR